MAATTTPIISGFTTITINYDTTPDPSSSKLKKRQQTQHYIYARVQVRTKKQTANKDTWPTGRTLFLVNVPPDATEREVMALFKGYGTVERVVFDLDGEKEEAEEEEESDEEEDEEMELDEQNVEENQEEGQEPRRKRRKVSKAQPPKVIPLPSQTGRQLRKTGQTVHVVFLDASSLDRAISIAPQKPRTWPSSDDEPSGLAHYLAAYETSRPPLDAVRQHADTFMESFDFQSAQARQKSKYRKGEAIVDEDGFTLVTRGGAYGKTLGGGVAVATKQFQQTGEASERNAGRPKKSKEKTNFYAFQKAEKQRNNLIELKRRWEEDKAKVDKLKASRHFRPY